MKLNHTLAATLVTLLLLTASTAQDKSKGSIRGKVRVERGSPGSVAVILRQGEREVSRVTTDRGGDFKIQQIPPGLYGLTFRKSGLSVGTVENVEVKAGNVRSIDHILLTVDEGSIAFIRGSVFDQDGRSFPGARVELARVSDDGTVKKIDGRVTNETGSFVFRLTPDPAKYRITAKADHRQPVSKDVDVDSAVVYRIALSLLPESK